MKNCAITTAAAFAAAIFLTGCANHLRDIVKENPENERTSTNVQHILTPDREAPDNVSLKVTVEKSEAVKINVYQIRKASSLVTPYDGWREIYEIPAGIGLLPVSIVSNIVSVFSFGIFPFSWSTEVTKFCFTGLNPFLNFKSEARAEEIPGKIERILVDSYSESKKEPFSEQWLIVRVGDEAYWRVQTDTLGRAEIVLLSTDLAKSPTITHSRTLEIYLENGNILCKSIPLSRRLLSRLNSARNAMMKYFSAPSGQSLATCVKALEELSFENLAFQLEDGELKKHPDFRQAFEQNVD